MCSKLLSQLRRAVPALAILLASCVGEPDRSPLTPSAVRHSSAPSATLVECESTATESTSETIGLLGGTLQLTDAYGGTHEVVFPADAVLTPTVFTLTVPASKYVEVRITGQDPLTGETRSLTFPEGSQPLLAISYKRCTRNDVNNFQLGLYNIDEATNAVLEGPFGGKENDPGDPRVTGNVPHFSDYAIGSPD